MKDYDPMFDEFPEDDPLICTPCDCAEYRRLTEACADLLRERDQLKKLIAEKDANLGKRVCQYTRCIQFSELQAERDALLTALIEIRDSKFCDYEATGTTSYGTGVTDGHRFCSNVARIAIDAMQEANNA